MGFLGHSGKEEGHQFRTHTLLEKVSNDCGSIDWIKLIGDYRGLFPEINHLIEFLIRCDQDYHCMHN